MMATDFWHILDINNVLSANKQLQILFNQFQYKHKKISINQLNGVFSPNDFSIHSPVDFILVAITFDLLADARKTLARLQDSYPQLPLIIVHDDSLLTLENIAAYNIDGFIDLNNFSMLAVTSLLKLSLKSRDTIVKNETKKQYLVDSDDTLSPLSRVMMETELLSLSGGWEWDVASEKLTWTPGAYRIHDVPLDKKITPEAAINFYFPAHRNIIKAAFNDVLSKEQEYDLTLKITTHLGQIKTIRTTGKVRKKYGKISHVFGSITDISHLVEVSKDIENKQAFIYGIFNGITDVVMVMDAEGLILDVNHVCTQTFGLTRKKLINKNISTFISLATNPQHQSYIEALVDTGKYQTIHLTNGISIPVEITISKVNQQDKNIYIALLKNIESQLLAEQQINNLAYKDKITQLANYQSFEKDYAALLTQQHVTFEKICFMQINIEKFFKINFAYGHTFGNKVLRYIAKILLGIAQKNNGAVYRISGISFILMLKYTEGSVDAFNEIINDTLNAFLTYHQLAGNHLDLTPIITMYSEDFHKLKKSGSEVLTLLESCKQSRDKQLNLTIIDDAYLSKVNRALMIEQILKRSIETGKGLYLLYQPQMNSAGLICSAEALIRMKDDKLGIIYPDEFIEIAERTGLIISLTKWILQQCLTTLTQLMRYKMAIPISVNISAVHIVQADFVDDIWSQINKFNIPPELLMLELTESAFTHDVNIATINMAELSRKNIKFSLDDFGTGYSNLGYLNQLPFSELKIDKVFIDNIVNNSQSKQLLEIIISIGKVKGLKIVAEGVETLEQINVLKQHDIDLYQGYYYSKPIEFEKLKSMLSNITH